jgi:hypothetical protein
MPTMIKNPQANAILECIHQVLAQMSLTTKIDMANSFTPSDIDVFLDIAAWAICSTNHIVLKASQDAAIFRCNMIFNILFVADWSKIGEHRQCQTDLNMAHENNTHVNYDEKIDKMYWWDKIVSSTKQKAHMAKNGTIRIQCRTKLERLVILREIPYTDK